MLCTRATPHDDDRVFFSLGAEQSSALLLLPMPSDELLLCAYCALGYLPLRNTLSHMARSRSSRIRAAQYLWGGGNGAVGPLRLWLMLFFAFQVLSEKQVIVCKTQLPTFYMHRPLLQRPQLRPLHVRKGRAGNESRGAEKTPAPL